MSIKAIEHLELTTVPEGFQCSMCKAFKAREHMTKGKALRVGSLCHSCKRIHFDLPYTARTKEQRSLRIRAKRYGIDPAAYRARFEQQHGRCAICQKEETGVIKGSPPTLAVDHDHASGAVRGLLCSKCNRGLGSFGDSIANLAAALDYLRRPTV